MGKPRYYDLAGDGKTPVAVSDFREVSYMWDSEPDPRRVAYDTRDGICVSTVFLVMDHQFDEDGPPLLWETMVWGLDDDQECERYSSYEEAVAGHKRLVSQYLGDEA